MIVAQILDKVGKTLNLGWLTKIEKIEKEAKRKKEMVAIKVGDRESKIHAIKRLIKNAENRIIITIKSGPQSNIDLFLHQDVLDLLDEKCQSMLKVDILLDKKIDSEKIIRLVSRLHHGANFYYSPSEDWPGFMTCDYVGVARFDITRQGETVVYFNNIYMNSYLRKSQFSRIQKQ